RLGKKSLSLRWSKMRASTDPIGPNSSHEVAELGRLLSRNEALLIGKFAGDRNVSRERVIDSLVKNVLTRISGGKAIVQTLFDEKSDTIAGIAVAEEAAW